MDSYEHALSLAQERNDHFLPRAFQIRQWLADCVLETCAAYANKKRRPDEPMQAGGVWSALLDVFDLGRDDQLQLASQTLFRFLNYAHPLSDLLVRTRAPLHIEHDVTGDYTGPRTLHLANDPTTAVPLLRRSLERWCDWIDAVNHLEVHRAVCIGDAGFEVTKDDEFAAFGYNLCKLPNAAPLGPSEPGNVHVSQSKTWPEEEVDTLLIALQPVAKRYAWSSAELLAALRKLVRNPAALPFRYASDLAQYRTAELALPPLAPENAPPDALAVGLNLALALSPLPTSRSLGEPPWS